MNVTVIRQVPQQLHDPRWIYHKACLDDDPPGRLYDLSVTKVEHDSLQAYVDSLFKGLEKDRDPGGPAAGLRYRDLASEMCGEKCLIGTGTRSYYLDHDHYSIEGTKQIEARASSLLGELLSRRNR